MNAVDSFEDACELAGGKLLTGCDFEISGTNCLKCKSFISVVSYLFKKTDGFTSIT